MEWLDDAINYGYICSIFSFWHKDKIDIKVIDNQLIPTDWTKLELEYEAYNRLIRKEGKSEIIPSTSNNLFNNIISRTKITEFDYYVNFNPKLVRDLVAYFSSILEARYNLPNDWQFNNFNIGEFKSVYITLQSLLYAWFAARIFCYENNIREYGYRSAVWVVSKTELFSRLRRYTKLGENKIILILDYLQYGNMGIREPDIAIQPLVDLNNGCFALSPFVWINSNAERNLCVLLNQIPEERKIYAMLVNEKEKLMRIEIEENIKEIGYEVKYGRVRDTNLDCAIIDRNEKVCLALELKWFIEPAEIREVIEKSEELIKGISQAKIIKRLFSESDEQLLKNILHIDSTYTFLSAVASRNWIGEFDIQDDEVPIIKIWPLIQKIKETKSLKKTFSWLSEREYLPNRGMDFQVMNLDFSFGKWKSTWYGIKPS